MQALTLTFAALSSGVFLLGAQAPTTTKYRIDQRTDQELDGAAIGQPKQSASGGSSMFVTLTMTDSAGGRSARLVVDSAVADTGALSAVMQPALDSLKGQAYHAFINNGKVTDVKAMKAGAIATASVTGLFNAVAPRVRNGAKVGAAWTDTTDVSNEAAGSSMKSRTVTNYKATGMETRAGVKALKVEGAASSALSGSSQGGTIEGTGTGASTFYVGPDGLLVSLSQTSNATLAYTVPQAAEPIPVTVKTHVMVIALR
ncbi:MAG: hypothetical protein ABI637_02010 [Gemmatimonadota bacterium]